MGINIIMTWKVNGKYTDIWGNPLLNEAYFTISSQLSLMSTKLSSAKSAFEAVEAVNDLLHFCDYV